MLSETITFDEKPLIIFDIGMMRSAIGFVQLNRSNKTP